MQIFGYKFDFFLIVLLVLLSDEPKIWYNLAIVPLIYICARGRVRLSSHPQ